MHIIAMKFNFTFYLVQACQQPIFLHCFPKIGTQDVFVPLITDFFLSFEVKKEFRNKHNSCGKSVKTPPSWLHVITEHNYVVKD